MKKIEFEGQTFEAGANWVQGNKNRKTGKENPIWTLAQKYELNGFMDDDKR